MPALSSFGPLVEEAAALAERRREKKCLSAQNGQHGPDGLVQLVRNSGRLVHDEQCHAEVYNSNFTISRLNGMTII
jgi:hypothetical protein